MPPVAFVMTICARIPTPEGEFQLCHFTNDLDHKEHLALVLGEVKGQSDLLVRVHSECFTGEVLGSLRCDCGEQLHRAMALIAAQGRGVIVYLRQEGRGIGLADKLRAYNLQDQGYDTVDANLMLGHAADARDYTAAAHILAHLGVVSLRLLTNNPLKIESLTDLGLQVLGRVPLEPSVNLENAGYLAAKVNRMRHLLQLAAAPGLLLPTEHRAGLQALAAALQTRLSAASRPFVTLSYAQSLDGCIAARAGAPLAISGSAAAGLTHTLRAMHQAILVGIGTVLADDPRLTVRLVEGIDPQPVVVDSHLRLPVTARLFQNPRKPWIATSAPDSDRRQTLEAAGASLLQIPAAAQGVDLRFLLAQLHERGIQSVMVEGGAQVLTAFLAQGLADFAVITVAPLFVAGLHAVAGLHSGNGPDSAMPRLADVQYTRAGDDLIVWGRLA